MHHPTDKITHITGFVYTSCGALAGTRTNQSHFDDGDRALDCFVLFIYLFIYFCCCLFICSCFFVVFLYVFFFLFFLFYLLTCYQHYYEELHHEIKIESQKADNTSAFIRKNTHGITR